MLEGIWEGSSDHMPIVGKVTGNTGRETEDMRVPLSTRKDKNIAEVAKKHYRKYLPTAISKIWAAQTRKNSREPTRKPQILSDSHGRKVREEDLSAFANSGQ